jgi:hypothetical protein
VEPDDPRDLALVEVAVNRVSDLVMKIGQVVGLGEDRLSERPSGEASLGGEEERAVDAILGGLSDRGKMRRCDAK